MRALNGLFGLAFVLSVSVQLNDPDPLAWIAIYGAAAGCCLGWELRRLPRPLPALVALAALVWAGWIAAGIELGVPLAQALGDWGMYGQGSEEAREIGGLGLVVIWCGALAARGTRAE